MSKRAKEEAWKVYPKRPEQKYTTAFGTFEFDYDAPNREGFIKGYELAEKDLGWHPASEHPPVDEVVIVLSNVLHDGTVLPDCRICFGHIVNTDTTVEVHGNPYKVESYNGWNIPGVVWWMPMPKLPKEEEK